MNEAVFPIAFSNYGEFIWASHATCFQAISTVMQHKLVVQVVAMATQRRSSFFFSEVKMDLLLQGPFQSGLCLVQAAVK